MEEVKHLFIAPGKVISHSGLQTQQPEAAARVQSTEAALQVQMKPVTKHRSQL